MANSATPVCCHAPEACESQGADDDDRALPAWDCFFLKTLDQRIADDHRKYDHRQQTGASQDRVKFDSFLIQLILFSQQLICGRS